MIVRSGRALAAGRQARAGHGRRMEEEVQDGDGDCTAGSSVALRGRFVGEKAGRSEGGIYHSARGMMPCLNKTSFVYRKLMSDPTEVPLIQRGFFGSTVVAVICSAADWLLYSESPSAKLRTRPQSNGTCITWSVMQPASCRFTLDSSCSFSASKQSSKVLIVR